MRKPRILIPIIALLSAIVAVAYGATETDGTEHRSIYPGVFRIDLKDPSGRWVSSGVEVCLGDPLVEVQTTLARKIGPLRETVGYMARTRKRGADRPVVVVGCDEPDSNGMPSGLLIEYRELCSAPGGGPSLVLSSKGRVSVGSFVLSATAVLDSGETIPIEKINRLPGPGESALLSYEFGPAPDLPGMVGVPLDIYYPMLDPFDCSIFKVGPAEETLPILPESVPDLLRSKTYCLLTGKDVYAANGDRLIAGSEVRVCSRLDSKDLNPEVLFDFIAVNGRIKDPAVWAVSGGRAVLRNGKSVVDIVRDDDETDEGRAGKRINALGVKPDEKILWVVSVASTSGAVVSISDVAECLTQLGATEGFLIASDVDSSIWVDGEYLNPGPMVEPAPSLAGALLVYSSAAEPIVEDVSILPGEVFLVPYGAVVPFEITAKDSLGRPMDLGPENVSSEILTGKGLLEGLRYVAPKKYDDTLILFNVHGRRESSYNERFLHVGVGARKPSRLVVAPDLLFLDPGASVDLKADVLDEKGNVLWIGESEIEWTLDGDIGVVSPKGRLITSREGKGEVVAKYRGVKEKAKVYVGGSQFASVSDFTKAEDWTLGFDSEAGNYATVASEDDVLRLSYTFSSTGDRKIELKKTIPIPGLPYGFRLSAAAENGPDTIHVVVKDAKGRIYTLRAADPNRPVVGPTRTIIPLAKAYPEDGDRKKRIVHPISFEGFTITRPPVAESGTGELQLGSFEVLYLNTMK